MLEVCINRAGATKTNIRESPERFGRETLAQGAAVIPAKAGIHLLLTHKTLDDQRFALLEVLPALAG